MKLEIIMTHLLDDARGCVSRLNNPESLHDFRVSARRLRVWYRAIDDERLVLVPKPCLRRLKRLVQVTNIARDLDVHMSLLKKNAKGLSKKDKAVVLKIEEEWQKKVSPARRKDTLQVGKLFPKVDTDCINVISKMTKQNAQQVRLSLWIGHVLAQKAKKLDSQLKRVKSIDDEKKIHKARLSAKALRYLAEPFVSETHQAEQLVEGLRELQDVIGSLRDIQTLVARIENSRVNMPEPLLKRLRQHGKILFKKFEKNYRKAPGFKEKAQLLFASIVQTS